MNMCGLYYLNQTYASTMVKLQGFFYLFLAGNYYNRQSLCINYDQKLMCEIQVLDVESVEFF